MLSLLGLEYTSILVDGSQKQQKSADFLAINPFGQVPVLSDDGVVFRDSQAILVYLARRYGNSHWLPDEAVALAEVTAWLSTAANEVALGPNRLRLHHKFGRDTNIDESSHITLICWPSCNNSLKNGGGWFPTRSPLPTFQSIPISP